jgi:hypothetical protein
MLAVDTNVVVRYLANDDAAHAARAQRLLARDDVFVPLTVLLETEWVLRGVFGFPTADVVRALRGFAGLPRGTVEARIPRRRHWTGRNAAWILPMPCIWRLRVRTMGLSRSTRRLSGRRAGLVHRRCGNSERGAICDLLLRSVIDRQPSRRAATSRRVSPLRAIPGVDADQSVFILTGNSRHGG